MRLVPIVIALMCAGSAIAAAEDRLISFDDILKTALERSPELARIDSLLAERLGEAEGTQLKENPSLSTELRRPTNRGGGESEYEAKVSQPLRLSDFGFRSELSALIRESATIEEKLALVEFTQNLMLAYAKAWALQERRKALLTAQERASSILDNARRVAAKGFLLEGDAAVFEGEVSLLSAEVVGADAERRRAIAQLTRASGAELSGAMLLPPPTPRLPDKAEVVRQAEENVLPTQRRSEILARVASKQLELARLDRFPRFAPGLGYERTDDGAQQVTLGLTVDLPFFDRNQAARVRALGVERAAAHMRDYALSGRLGDEVRMLYEAASSLADQRRRFERDVIPARERALTGYRKQFDVGQGTAFQVWQAQRELTDSRLRALDLWSEERIALTELSILLGNDL